MRAFVLGVAVLASSAVHAAEPNICKAIPASQLERVQKAKLLIAKPTEHDDGKLTTSACYFRMDPDALSVSLEIMSRSKGDSIDPREFWESRFREREVENGKELSENEEKRVPPEKLNGLGDDAYWVDTG